MTPYCKKRVERWHYNEFGQIHKKTYYSTKRYGKIAEKFYDRNGNKYCEKFLRMMIKQPYYLYNFIKRQNV